MRVDLLCSWGGHLQEMLELKDAWGEYDYRFITYRSCRSEAMDCPKMLITIPDESIPRYMFTMVRAMLHVIFDRPDVLISTGMGWVDIAMFPLCKILGTYTIYIESGANVKSITGTANFIRRFCDRFIVKWEELAQSIGAEYRGGIF